MNKVEFLTQVGESPRPGESPYGTTQCPRSAAMHTV